MGVSKEFCAGTHVENTADVLKYCIYSFESIGSGVFRITAATGPNAMEIVKKNISNLKANLDSAISKALDIIKAARNEGVELHFNYDVREIHVEGYRYVLALRGEIIKAQNALKELEKDYQAKKSQNALKDLNKFDSEIIDNKLFVKVDEENTNLLKDMATALRNNKGLDLVLLAYANDSKVTFVCATSPKYDARAVVKEACSICGGGGGGKPDLAQAGGKDPSKLMNALEHLKATI